MASCHYPSLVGPRGGLGGSVSLECARHFGALVQSVACVPLPGGDSELEWTLDVTRKRL